MKVHFDTDANTSSGGNIEQGPRTECPLVNAEPVTKLEITENYRD
jgi:hypothetical protein